MGPGCWPELWLGYLRLGVEGEPQVSPLRFAPAEMTNLLGVWNDKGEGALPWKWFAGWNLSFMPLGRPPMTPPVENISMREHQHRDLSTTLRFGRDDKGGALPLRVVSGPGVHPLGSAAGPSLLPLCLGLTFNFGQNQVEQNYSYDCEHVVGCLLTAPLLGLPHQKPLAAYAQKGRQPHQ